MVQFVVLFYNSNMLKSKYLLSQATLEHRDWILQQIDGCRQQMASHGSGQWQGKEPSLATIEEDIHQNRFYLLFENDQPCGGAALMNHEPGYDHLREGHWLNQDPYMVIHRFFIAPSYQGQHLSPLLLDQLEQLVQQRHIINVRLDTHALNQPMRGLLMKQQYQEVGKAWLPQAGERLVYHKVLGVKYGTKE
jgi:GNAT superfamily N-acetyltransferase